MAELEQRYVVLKIKDVEQLTERQKDALYIVESAVQQLRYERGVAPAMPCLVVEKDWPEYAPTLAAILARSACALGTPLPPVDPGEEAWRQWGREFAERRKCPNPRCDSWGCAKHDSGVPVLGDGQPVAWRFKSREGGEWHFDGTKPIGHVFCVERLYAHGVAPTAAPGVGPCAQCPTLVIPAGFSCAQCGRTSGVSLVDGESSLHQTPIPSPMDNEGEG